MTIRAARPDDVPEILAMIRELAEFEREPDAVENTEAMLTATLFADHPMASCLVVDGDEPGALAAMALWYPTYSTWTGVHGIHLEDLYVRPEHRRGGHGRALLARLAAETVERGWARLEWDVLDWNENAIAFYRSLGAEFKDDWTTCRLDGDVLLGAAQAASLEGRA
jgi:GNAT superfamily N-acetyltransferase